MLPVDSEETTVAKPSVEDIPVYTAHAFRRFSSICSVTSFSLSAPSPTSCVTTVAGANVSVVRSHRDEGLPPLHGGAPAGGLHRAADQLVRAA